MIFGHKKSLAAKDRANLRNYLWCDMYQRRGVGATILIF